MRDLQDYELYIIDMDGTLYFQRKMQLLMGLRLLGSALTGKRGAGELKTVLTYRKLREQCKGEKTPDDQLIEQIAQKKKTEPQSEKQIIEKWLYLLPLDVIAGCRDKKMTELVTGWKRAGKKVVIYSDYPAEHKCKALGLSGIPCFDSTAPSIDALKPDPKGIEVILREMGVTDRRKAVMIGDRQSRDGEAAARAGIDCLILKKYALLRKKQYHDAGLL